jgi:hypothetical protein
MSSNISEKIDKSEIINFKDCINQCDRFGTDQKCATNRGNTTRVVYEHVSLRNKRMHSDISEKIDKSEIINFKDCINKGDLFGIDQKCATSIGNNTYIVNENASLRTKGLLERWPVLRFSRRRFIETEFLLPPGTKFETSGNTVKSDCLYPEQMKYQDKRWHDKRWHDKIYDLKPTTGVDLVPFGACPCTWTDFYLGVPTYKSKARLRSHVDDYKNVGDSPIVCVIYTRDK